MSVGWESDADPQSQIVELTALADAQWQHSRTTFTSIPNDFYRVSKRTPFFYHPSCLTFSLS